MNVAVIPARGGSKRIPRKNIKEFSGRPIIAYSIECARQSGLFQRVIVSTDDPEIARVAEACGAEVPFMRPATLADDHAGTTEVIAHAVAWLKGQATEPLAVCCINATAPFVRREDLKEALTVLESGTWQYVFAATAFEYPILRSFQRQNDQGIAMCFPEHFHTRSQDLPETLHDAGQFYWGRPDAWLSGARIFDRASTVVIIPRWRAHDIDTLDDWTHAELMWDVMQRIEAAH